MTECQRHKVRSEGISDTLVTGMVITVQCTLQATAVHGKTLQWSKMHRGAIEGGPQYICRAAHQITPAILVKIKPYKATLKTIYFQLLQMKSYLCTYIILDFSTDGLQYTYAGTALPPSPSKPNNINVSVFAFAIQSYSCCQCLQYLQLLWTFLQLVMKARNSSQQIQDWNDQDVSLYNAGNQRKLDTTCWKSELLLRIPTPIENWFQQEDESLASAAKQCIFVSMDGYWWLDIGYWILNIE